MVWNTLSKLDKIVNSVKYVFKNRDASQYSKPAKQGEVPMSEYLEIEKKYQIEKIPQDFLKAHFQFAHEKRVLDRYFDTSAGDWYQKGIFIRIRNDKSLDVKFNPDHLGKSDVTDHVSCHEYNFREPFGEKEVENLKALEKLIGLNIFGVSSFESFLEKNQLELLLEIDKVRTTYQNDTFTIVIDDIQNLGRFLEVEYSGSLGVSIDQVVQEIDALMAGVPAQPLASGSFEMCLRRANFDLYNKGKYFLEEEEKQAL